MTVKRLLRLVTLILAGALLLPLLSACGGDTDVSGSLTESTGDTSEDTSGTVVGKTYRTPVSTGKSYTVSQAASDIYPDSYGAELTDGVTVTESGSYSDERFAGFNIPSLSVIIDLGETNDRLYAFEAGYLAVSVAGIAAPSSIAVQVSNDGEDWDRIGMCVKPAYEEGTTQRAVLEKDDYISARYIRFIISSASAWVFLDELTVYADVEGDTDHSLEDTGAAYEADATTDADIVAALSSVTTSAPDLSLPLNIISKGSSYKLSRPADTERYPDDGSKLTDGSTIGSHYESGHWVGFAGSEALTVTVDLGEVRDDIAKIALSVFSRIQTGIVCPTYVDILVSDDGEDFVKISRIYSPTDSSMSNYTYAFIPEKCIRARYFRFDIAGGNREWLLIEEAAAYAHVVDAESEPMYPALELAPVNGVTHWPSDSEDYDEEQNLILGRPQQILDGAMLKWADSKDTNTPASSKILTDGILSNDTGAFNGRWFKTAGGTSRDIFYDLEYHSTVTGFAVNFLQLTSWGIHLPEKVTLYLSSDGVEWYPVRTEYLEQLPGDSGICKINIKLAQPTEARFARFSFPVSVHVYFDELSVYGTKEVKRGVTPLDKLGITPEKLPVNDDGTVGQYDAVNDDVLGGAADIMLAYHATERVLDKDFFLAYAGYLDNDLKITDIMFDSFLFLPSTAALPSGGFPYNSSVKSDWDYIFEDLFKEGRSLDALNEAAGEVKAATGNSDYKYKVFLTIMHPTPTVTDFGDVDGDGKSENLSDHDDMMKVVDWYVTRCTDAFENAGYENLELCGWYWFHEAISTKDGDDDAIRSVSEYLEDRGTELFWIPYYKAGGFTIWKDCGFVRAYMQPNYAFSLDVDERRIGDAVQAIMRYGMAIEIEIDPLAFGNDLYYEKYMGYLRGGVNYGYMTGAAHAYYQGIDAFYIACHSENPKWRLIYDYTYMFIKGTLSITPDAPDDVSVSTEKDKYVTSQIGTPEAGTYFIASSPAHGTVTVNSDGTFVYYPNKGFTGTDSFTVTLYDGLGHSEPAKITVTVS